MVNCDGADNFELTYKGTYIGKLSFCDCLFQGIIEWELTFTVHITHEGR